VLRYTLTANAPETKDNNFTWKDFQARNNNELVAVFGNFINRVVVLMHKYYDGKIPVPNKSINLDKIALGGCFGNKNLIEVSIKKFKFRQALTDFMNIARIGNEYLASQEPWKTIKTDEERTKTVMYIAAQIAASLAILSEPFLPFSSEKLKNMLEFPLLTEKPEWNSIEGSKFEILPPGHTIGKAELLFSKIEDKEIQVQLDKLEASKKVNEADNKVTEPQKDTITFEDFKKLDIRVGTILDAKKIPKTKKLLVLKVDTGIDVRIIVSGIAESFTADEVIGKRVTVLVNLAPRTLRGIDSEGMILMTETPEGKLVFVNPGNIKVGNGLQIS